ncbi:outer membrane receptor protein involved in Fe transport [Ancylomarina subtilis]|uniref:Outer membrane receptor protein involved in Fe transport n=1 Tax=Ancylomarina subtilis TaxID=1639035 RepID=A0A4Q7VA42_9BACT|nr:TonB-dependent receptor [Ancylomarina subtilis]RZT92430.1 outer membrane receptor protein involved in Fe transport [Ancylomarina subtilis]
MTKQVFLVLLLNISFLGLFAQQTSITGNVKDVKLGETLIGASVYVEGTTIGTVTDFDGNYTLKNIPVGTINLKCSFISYETVTKKSITLSEGDIPVINFEMGASSVELNDVVVIAKAKRESALVLLMDQKKSAVMKQSIGAQQLATQGISDAASAASKITGVSKQEGNKGLSVRGLGDRYNTSSLNGLPLPSNNAEYKNIELGLFSTDIIEFIDVEKVPTAHLYGDFAGANINIVSKVHSGKTFLKLGLKTGYNLNLADADKFYLGDGPGAFGFDNFNYPQDLSTYNFETHWNPEEKTVYPNMEFKLSGGKTFTFENSELNAFASLSFDNEYSYSDYLERKVNGSDYVRADVKGEKYNYTTQSTGMLNLNYNWKKNKLFFNSILLNTSDQMLREVRGTLFDLAEVGALVRRSEYERNTVWVNQLLGKYELKEKMGLNWGIAFNKVNNIVPDRKHNTMENGTDSEKYFATNDQANNNRYFHDLIEDELAANLSVDYQFGEGFADADYKGRLTFGYSGKYKTRAFEATQFNHKIKENRLVNVDDIDSYFNNDNLQKGLFDLKVLSSDFVILSTYDGEQVINAGFASLEYNLSPRLLALLGVRIEHVFQKIEYKTALGKGKEDFNELNVLPSLSLKYALNDRSNLRFASGITYTLPQFKESALFLFEGITDVTVGNPYLTPSTNYNGEIKWEFFPKPSELISVAAFGKYIVDPINKFVRASAGNEFTYANTGDWAYLYGVELEAKKDIMTLSSEHSTKKFNLSANLTLMDSKQELDQDKIITQTKGQFNANFNKKEEKLQGAAPLIANANMTYKYTWAEGKKSITSSLIYTYVSDRLNLIGYSSLGNQVDKGMHTLDFVMKSKIKQWGLSLSAKNILNQDIERKQENASRDWIVKSYNKGVELSVGLSYTF